MLFRLYAFLFVCCLGGFYSPRLDAQCAINTTAYPASCGITNDGLIGVLVTGAAAPYNYAYSGSASGSGNSALDTFNINALPAGSYDITVTDGLGCSATSTVVISQAPSTIVLTIVANALCASSSIDLSVSGGFPSYTYVWSTGSTTQDLNGLAAGSYAVTVTDAVGCSQTATETVTAPNEMVLQFITIPVFCADENNGSIDLTVSGGVSPYNYDWSGLAGSNNPQDPNNLPAGTYTVTVTDASGCTKSGSAMVTQPAQMNLTTILTNVNCFNGSTGTINLTVSGGASGYTYQWNNGSTVQDLFGLTAGTYTVTVTDMNGCTSTTSGTVTQPPPLNVQTTVTPAACSLQGGSINLSVTGGTSPYTFHWSHGATTKNVSNLGPGSYGVTVTDANGCMAIVSPTVTQGPPFTVTPIVTYTDCATATVELQLSGGTAPYAYSWSFPFANPSFPIVKASGSYTIIVTEASGCTAVATVDIELGANGLCGIIEGRVLHDTTKNCQTDAEPGLANWIVRAVGAATYYAITDAAGQYQIGVKPGTYTLETVSPNALWEPCPSTPTVTITQPSDTLTADDLLVQSIASCPALSVTIGTSLLRRCMTSSYTVDYCNQGPAEAQNAYIIVQLDAYLSALSASIPYIDLGNGQLRFELGNLPTGACGSFNFYVNVSCTAVLGQTHCTEAHIYPDGTCLPPNASWSGASLQVQSNCDGDSLHFLIKNVGANPLTEMVNYVVIEDHVMLMQATVPPLTVGGSVQVAVPANGSTWRMEVQQAAFHPGMSQPALSVEGCSTTGVFTTGFVSQFPTDDADRWVDIDCTENVGSYDPNDKQGFPLGYGAEHYIRPGTDLEYKIRFQNTGTDTAFTVLLVDTLSSWLDPATVQPGPSSHPYRFEIYGPGILKFHFENILLPDSNVNEAASHGFVQFRISPRASTPLETGIENQAQIFFDLNDPVLTNTTFHRLGEQFITSGTWQPRVPGATILIAPNPFDQQARLDVKGLTTNSPLQLQLFDLQGALVSEMRSNDSTFLLKKGDWPTGVYLFRITQNGQPVGMGKLVVQ